MNLGPVLPLLLVVLAPAASAQAHWFVDGQGGRDSNPGTTAQPLRSISFAVQRAGSADTIWVRPATYSATATGEVFPILIGGPRNHTALRIRGAGPSRVVLDMEQRGGGTFHLSGQSANNVRVSGLTITNAGTADWYASGFLVGSSQGSDPVSSARIDHIAFDHCNRGVVFWGTTPSHIACSVDDCLFLNLANDAIDDFSSSGQFLFHNTVLNTSQVGMTIAAPQAVVVNNVLVGCRVGMALGAQATGASVSNNDFFANGTDFQGAVNPARNGFVDPQFVNQAAGDARLAATSPLRDAAQVSPGVLDRDLDGNPRALDADGDGFAIADLGCFERTDVRYSTIGTWRIGQSVQLDVSAPAGNQGLLLFARGERVVPLPGGAVLLLDPAGLLPLVFAVTSTPGRYGLLLPNDPNLTGTRIHLQALVVDPQLRLTPTNDLIEWF